MPSLPSSGEAAVALGSGDVDVLGTPRLLAWLRGGDVVAAAGPLLSPGRTSVGTRVELEHWPPPRRHRVTVEADLAHQDGRLLRFAVAADDCRPAGGQRHGHPGRGGPGGSWRG